MTLKTLLRNLLQIENTLGFLNISPKTINVFKDVCEEPIHTEGPLEKQDELNRVSRCAHSSD